MRLNDCIIWTITLIFTTTLFWDSHSFQVAIAQDEQSDTESTPYTLSDILSNLLIDEEDNPHEPQEGGWSLTFDEEEALPTDQESSITTSNTISDSDAPDSLDQNEVIEILEDRLLDENPEDPGGHGSAEESIETKILDLTTTQGEVPIDTLVVAASPDTIAVTIEIPAETVFHDEHGVPVQEIIEEPTFSEAAPVNDMMQSITTIHYGDEDTNITFTQDGQPSDIDFTVTFENQAVEAGETVYLHSSSDGEVREYEGTYEVSTIEGQPSVTFSTPHLTYFNISAMSGTFTINNDDTETATTAVTLYNAVNGATEMKFGLTTAARDAAPWISYAASTGITLNSGTGTKTVYGAFKNANGDIAYVSDDIILDPGTYAIDTVSMYANRDASKLNRITTGAAGVSGRTDDRNSRVASQPNVNGNRPDLIDEPYTPYTSIQFNGVDDYLAIVPSFRASLAGAAVCAVFRTAQATGENIAFISYDDTKYFSFYASGDQLAARFNAGAVQYQVTAGSGINDNRLHVGCRAYNRAITNDVRFLLDGNLIYDAHVAPTNASLGTNTTVYGFIGDGSRATTFNGTKEQKYYQGALAQLAFYNANKTTAQLTTISCTLANKRNIPTSSCGDSIAPIATISYSPLTATTGSVTATLTGYSEEITITNNGGSDTYVFTTNGTFAFAFEDAQGNTGSVTAQVDRITPQGQLSIAAPTPLAFTGIQASGSPQITTRQFTGYFSVDDGIGANAGWYTTLSMTIFSGSTAILSNASAQRRATTLDTLSGSPNANVVIATGFQSYSLATGAVTFIKRDSGQNNWLTGTYGAKPEIQLTLPAYTPHDSYTAIITYTLYEN